MIDLQALLARNEGKARTQLNSLRNAERIASLVEINRYSTCHALGEAHLFAQALAVPCYAAASAFVASG